MLPEFTADAVSAISSTANYKPGYKVVTKSTVGTKTWIYVQNGSAGSITTGLGVMVKSGSAAWVADVSGAATSQARFIGVAQTYTLNGAASDFLQNYYGFVLEDGVGSAVVVTGVAANANLTCAASGKFDTGTIGANDIVAFTPTANASGGDLTLTVYIKR